MRLKTLTSTIMFGITALVLPTAPTYAAPSQDEAAQIMASADITVGLSGLVCDFCSIALNKTFKKQDGVSATYVDLDTKTLSVILKSGTTLDDAQVTKLVEKAGYSVTDIARKSNDTHSNAPTIANAEDQP